MDYTHPKCTIVAEACCNHAGDFDRAIEMIEVAKLCGADFVKFQKRCPEESVPEHWHNQPHPNPVHAYGDTYLEHRKALEFTIDQHAKLKERCDNLNIGYSTSVWDMTSAEEVMDLNPPFIKIPSAMNTHYEMLEYIYMNYEGQVHISMGMTTDEEKTKIKYNINPFLTRTVIYHTTTEYPVPFERLHLKEVEWLQKLFPIVGYSGHNYGIAADVAAYTLGAQWIERHFTLDRTAKGTDNAASLESDGLRRLCRDVKAVQKALAYRDKEITDNEMKQRDKMKFSKV